MCVCVCACKCGVCVQSSTHLRVVQRVWRVEIQHCFSYVQLVLSCEREGKPEWSGTHYRCSYPITSLNNPAILKGTSVSTVWLSGTYSVYT